MTVNCLLSPQPSTEICFAPVGPQVHFWDGKRHKPVSSMLMKSEGGMLYFRTINTTHLRNILFTSKKSSGKLWAALVMVLHLSPIFNKNFLYQDFDGTHDILWTSKNPSTIGIRSVVESGNPALYWATTMPARRHSRLYGTLVLFVFNCCSSPHGRLGFTTDKRRPHTLFFEELC